MHRLTEPVWDTPFILLALVALNVVVVLLDPWWEAILKRVPNWCIFGCCIIGGVALNWAWASSWSSQRYALSSAPILRMTASFVALNSLIGFMAARLLGGKWQLAGAFFVLASAWLGWFFHG